MRRWCISIAALSVFILMGFSAQAEDAVVSGDWELAVQTPQGEMAWSVNFVQEGGKLTVTMVGPRGREFKGEGTVKEKAIEWSVTWSSERGEMTIAYKGTVEGASMSGTGDWGGFRTFEWKAKKK